jgi:hypothetical protein
MAKMTPTQRKYAVERINKLTEVMKQAVAKKFIIQEMKDATIGEIVKLIKNGTIKPNKENAKKKFGTMYGRCNQLNEAFVIEDPSPYLRSYPVCDVKKRNAACAAIEDKAIRLEDQLMLSDADKALKIVQDYDNEAYTMLNNGR